MHIWKCPNCETINNGEVCTVCGEKYSPPPQPRQTEAGATAPQNSGAGTYAPHADYAIPREAAPKRGNPWVVFTVVLLVILLAVVSVAAGYLLIFKSGGDGGDSEPKVSSEAGVNPAELSGHGSDGADDTEDTRYAEKGGNSDGGGTGGSKDLPLTVRGVRIERSKKRNGVSEPEPPKDNTPSANPEPSTGAAEPGGNSGGADSSSGASDGYSVYSNSDYGFSCMYPSHFVVTSQEPELCALTSPDEDAMMFILCTSDEGMSPQDAYDKFIAEAGGDNVSQDYKAVGSGYFAARLHSGVNGYYYYKYAKFAGGRIYSFEVIFPDYDFAYYDSMINDIYADFVSRF